MKNSFSLVVLSAIVLKPEWAFLRPLFHPGMLEKDGRAVLVGTKIDLGGTYLGITLVLPDELKGRKVYLPHGLVDAILERKSRSNPFGFWDQEK